MDGIAETLDGTFAIVTGLPSLCTAESACAMKPGRRRSARVPYAAGRDTAAVIALEASE